MKKNRQTSSIFFVSLLCLMLAFTSCNTNPELRETEIINGEVGESIDAKLTPYLENIMATHNLPGMAIGLVKDNEIVYARAFGYDNIADSIPTTIYSLYHMASISKPFVATAIMQLLEDGKIDLDETVVTYLPYFKVVGEKYDKITIKQMLNHISGMPDVKDYEWYDPQYDEGAIERYVRSISEERMISEPGQSFAYSNMAFECLGDVISKVSGMSFADYCKKNILDPIGMEKSNFLKPEYLPENWASPYIRIAGLEEADDYPYNRRHGPSSTLHSNVVEMCYWALANMNMGIYDNKRILEAESYNDLWMPWHQIGETRHIGLSWFLDIYGGHKLVGHGGGDLGFRTNLMILPKEKMSVVVVCNLNPAPVGEIANAAIDVMLGNEAEKAKAPASASVFKELNEKGVEAAIILWKTLETDHPDDYDFGPQQFFPLLEAMAVDRVEDAENLTRLCLGIFQEEVIQVLKEEAEAHAANHPENMAAPAMLKIIEGGEQEEEKGRSGEGEKI